MSKREEQEMRDRALYIISVAAELAGVHPQTLRIYERKGLLHPARTAGNTRRYSDRDLDRLRTIQKLTQEYGVNLAGVKMIVELENEMDRLRQRMERLARDLEATRRRLIEEQDNQERVELVPYRSQFRWPWESGGPAG
jgi:MerR family transcriptional regulator/heat shock protein HspR